MRRVLDRADLDLVLDSLRENAGCEESLTSLLGSLEPDLLLALAGHAGTPLAALRILGRSSDLQVASSARGHVALAGEHEASHPIEVEAAFEIALRMLRTGESMRVLEELVGLIPLRDLPAGISAGALLQGIDNPSIPDGWKSRLLERLSLDPDARLRRRVALHPRAPLEMLERLAGDVDGEVRDAALRVDLLDRLPAIEAAVREARETSTPPGRLRELAGSPWSMVALAVAAHPTAPEDARMLLAAHPLGEIRQHVLENPATGARALAILAADPGLRMRVAADPRASPATLTDLAGSGAPALRHRVAANPSAPAAALRMTPEGDRDLRHLLARHRNTAPEVLEQLAGHGDPECRLFLLENPGTPVDVARRLLRELAGEAWVESRLLAARHPLAPASLLETLSQDAERWVRARVAANPGCPVPVLEALASRGPDVLDVTEVMALLEEGRLPDGVRDLAGNVAEGLPDPVALGIATNPAAPASLLARLGGEELEEAARRFLGVTFAVVPVPAPAPSPAVAPPPPRVASTRPPLPRVTLVRKVKLPGSEQSVRITAQDGHDLESSARALLARAQDERRTRALERLAHGVPFSEAWVREVLRHVRLRVALHTSTPRELRERLAVELAGSADPAVRRAIARSDVTPVTTREALLRELAGPAGRKIGAPGPVPEPVGGVVESPPPGGWLWPSLSRMKAGRERGGESAGTGPAPASVAADPSTPPEVLAILAAHDDEEVWVAVMRNVTSPGWILERCARREEMHRRAALRRVLARHPAAPPWFLDHSAADREPPVREALAGNPALPASLAARLVRDEAPEVRRALAGSPAVTSSIGLVLAVDRDPGVRASLRGNPRLSGDLVVSLGRLGMAPGSAEAPTFAGASRAAREEAALDPATPGPVLEELARDTTLRPVLMRHDAGVVAVLGALLESPHLEHRVHALRHPRMPARALSERAGSFSWPERFAVAMNPATPDEILTRLAEDAHRLVRAATRASRGGSGDAR